MSSKRHKKMNKKNSVIRLNFKYGAYMQSNIKISVVTVCYNAVDTIEETMLSVLNQTYHDVEYIVIDGGSKDGTVDIIKKHADRLAYWVSEPDNGIYDAMNKGIKVATGDYINFMNAGDSFFDINVISEIFINPNLPEATVIYGDTLEKHEHGEKIQYGLDVHKLNKKGILCHQSAFIKTAYHKIHPYDLKFKILADFNFFFRAYNLYNQSFFKINKVVSRFSMIDSGLSKSNYDENYKEFFQIANINLTPFDHFTFHVRRILGKIKRNLF